MRGLRRLISGNRAHLRRSLEPYLENGASRHTCRRLLSISSSSSSNHVLSRSTQRISTPVGPSSCTSSGLANFLGLLLPIYINIYVLLYTNV